MDYWVRFSEKIGKEGGFQSEGLLHYGDNHYQVALNQDVDMNQVGYNMTSQWLGRYGGTWSDWYVFLLFSKDFLKNL